MVKKKRTGIPWGPKNPLWKWQHGKKVTKVTEKIGKVKEMVKKTRTRRKTYGKKRRKRDNRMPMSAIVGIATSVLAPPAPGWGSVMDQVKGGYLDLAAQSFIRAWTGIALPIGGQTEFGFDVMATLNPFEFREAPAWKAMFWSALSAKIVKKITHQDPLAKIPILNKFVKFS